MGGHREAFLFLPDLSPDFSADKRQTARNSVSGMGHVRQNPSFQQLLMEVFCHLWVKFGLCIRNGLGTVAKIVIIGSKSGNPNRLPYVYQL
jgi:hypothetical protein